MRSLFFQAQSKLCGTANKLIINPLRVSRQGWGAKFAAMAEHGDDRLLDQVPATQWEEDEWTW